MSPRFIAIYGALGYSSMGLGGSWTIEHLKGNRDVMVLDKLNCHHVVWQRSNVRGPHARRRVWTLADAESVADELNAKHERE